VIAPLPDNETTRLEKLHQLKVLDTLPEETYDDVAYLASEIAQTPIALISLVDEKRQWFKSRIGLDAQETSRDYAFCSHAILTPDELFVVPNAAEDDRFSDNPLVTGGPRIAFYAGAPLVCSDGHALGTLCVIDRSPRRLKPQQQKALTVLSRQVVAQLELRDALAQVKTLHGMFPICPMCKRVREDSGYWKQVETYISQHSQAQFCHSVCPDCIEIVYP